jgi:methanogenic corrinoid protein MtbC1
LTQEDAAARFAGGTTTGGDTASTRSDAAFTTVVEEALAHTVALDAAALDGLLRRTAAQFGVATFTERVAAPMLHRVGDEWHAGRLTIAHEHLASAAVHDILVETMRALARDAHDARVVVATPPGDRHAIGAALAGAAAAAEGWGVIYLGTDVPAGEIAAAAVATGARAVAISVVYVDDRERTLGDLRTLRARLPASVTLLVGGAGATLLAADLGRAGIHVGASVEALRVALRTALHDAPVAGSR